MNLIPKIAELLGVEIGEEFLLKAPSPNGGDITIDSPYRFRERLEHKNLKGEWKTSNYALEQLISGNFEIVKLPFEPKKGEKYSVVSVVDMAVRAFAWDGTTSDYCYKACGNCFRTEAEAEKHKYDIYEKLTGKKWGREIKMTNFQRITASPEALAKWLEEGIGSFCDTYNGRVDCEKCPIADDCDVIEQKRIKQLRDDSTDNISISDKDYWLAWLKQESDTE